MIFTPHDLYCKAVRAVEEGELTPVHVGTYDERVVIILHKNHAAKEVKVIDLVPEEVVEIPIPDPATSLEEQDAPKKRRRRKRKQF